MTRLFALTVTAAAATAACIAPAEPDESVAISAAGGGTCPKSDCGTNSTVVDGVYFSDLNLLGLPNDSGVRITGFGWLPPGATRLDVRRNRLVAINAAKAIVAEFQQLVGSEIQLQITNATGVSSYTLRIAGVNRTTYWAADDGTAHETYRFQYLRLWPNPVSVFTPACQYDEESGNLALDAVVFEGELYDARTKDILPFPGPGWFNVACLGGAPAKMELMRHTQASSKLVAGITTTLAERRALFNAYTGNFCGDGLSFTKPGEPLRLRDSNGWLPLTSGRSWQDGDAVLTEAIWDEDGAICLDEPRRELEEPGIREKIQAHCTAVRGAPLPSCAAYVAAPFDVGHIFTATP